jgi:pimeloyl-ACP methyl ester carboxylesterase
VLLHGFPEFWWSWRRQIPALAAAGYRVVAPDLRGYHRSSKPKGVGAYRIDRLAEDLRALLDDLGPAPHPVVAHDWGAAVAWWSALLFPERIARLAILNTPHPAVFRRALATSAAQRRRVGYMLYFQLPWLPERKLSGQGGRALRSMFRRTSRPGTFTDDELARYAAASAVPGSLTAMLNWYRAAARRLPPRPPSLVVEPQVCIVWGTQDVALGEEMVEPSARLCREAEVFRLPEAGHWVHHEEPERVNRLLLDFLAAVPLRSASHDP